ncbi:hypothetical protein [Streptomyces sp. NPDC058674]|uniref:hypothetical protein n=1 Tax=Streptomyces sp. NPDC058674 TaxID=3346592 RepID=UPI00365BB6F6
MTWTRPTAVPVVTALTSTSGCIQSSWWVARSMPYETACSPSSRTATTATPLPAPTAETCTRL